MASLPVEDIADRMVLGAAVPVVVKVWEGSEGVNDWSPRMGISYGWRWRGW